MTGRSNQMQAFSCRGMFHIGRGIENQDAADMRQSGRYSSICLADGVSTCSRAAAGAVSSVRRTTRVLFDSGNYIFTGESEEVVSFLLDEVRYSLKQKAEKESGSPEEYSSTLAFAFYDSQQEEIALFSLGDSLVLGLKKDQVTVLIQPEQLEEGTGCTTTEKAEKLARFRRLERDDLQGVMILSDGAWRILFRRGRLNPEAKKLILSADFDGLQAWLKKAEPFDDCSFTCLLFQPADRKEREKE